MPNRIKPKSRTFYYRNRHDKVIALQESVAAEQHNKHKKYLGNSDDLKKLGYNSTEQVGKFLEENQNKIDKNPPQDQRRILKTSQGDFIKGQQGTNVQNNNNSNVDIDKLVAERVKEELKKAKENEKKA